MRILVVSNFYPPHFFGGYELGCREVVNRLSARGHEIRILTSTYGVEGGKAEHEDHVDRILTLSLSLPNVERVPKRNLSKDCLAFVEVVRSFSPDVVYFWNQTGLCLWLPDCARLLGRKSAFFISDTSFTAWRTRAFLRRWLPTQTSSPRVRSFLQLLLSKVSETWLIKGASIIHGQACHFASDFLRTRAAQEKVPFSTKQSEVIHWGVDLDRFQRAPAHLKTWPPRRLLYVGQVIPQKGVHTLIEALPTILKQPGCGELSLTIVGGSSNPDYEKTLHALPGKLHVADRVRFSGKVLHSELPDIYHQHDVLMFPSMWEEPFAITPLEAMAARLPVVGTTTGGSGELFENESTAMVFQAGNAEDCARALARLCSSQELFEGIRSRAFDLVASRYTLNHMAEQIEQGLGRIVRGG